MVRHSGDVLPRDRALVVLAPVRRPRGAGLDGDRACMRTVIQVCDSPPATLGPYISLAEELAPSFLLALVVGALVTCFTRTSLWPPASQVRVAGSGWASGRSSRQSSVVSRTCGRLASGCGSASRHLRQPDKPRIAETVRSAEAKRRHCSADRCPAGFSASRGWLNESYNA